MSNIIPVKVKFMDAALQGAIRDGQRYVALRPIVEGMGLDWASQYTKVQRDEVIGPTVVEITMVAEDGKRRSMTCIPDEYLQGWMFSIKAGKVRQDLREKVLHYKRQCYRVLHDAFTAAQATEGPLAVEYLDGYHEMHEKAHQLAAGSKNERFVHMNLNKLVNKTVGIGAGQRAGLNAPVRSLTIVAQTLAVRAMQGAQDHHDGYEMAKSALGQLGHALQIKGA